MRVVVSWSSGKDSCWALAAARREGHEVVGLLTTVTAPFDRVSMHGVRRSLLLAQAQALGLPLHVAEIPSPCPNELYRSIMGEAVDALLTEGTEGVVFGDLFLTDVREYREKMLAPTALVPLFPLWGLDTHELSKAMLSAGLFAHLTTVDPRKLSADFAGRRYDHALLASMPKTVDPCGEHGEFHTFVSDGPGFSAPIPIVVGETIVRDGFAFADLDLHEDKG